MVVDYQQPIMLGLLNLKRGKQFSLAHANSLPEQLFQTGRIRLPMLLSRRTTLVSGQVVDFKSVVPLSLIQSGLPNNQLIWVSVLVCVVVHETQQNLRKLTH